MNEQDYLSAASRLETDEGLDAWSALMRVLVATLRTLEIPAPLRPALSDAERHWDGHHGDLLSVKADVWRFINDNWPAGTELTAVDGRKARALLCVVEPSGDDEARSLTAEWFAAMVHGDPATAQN